MSETKHTPGPWRWQGEDYRGGWGWQMLVGPEGEGIIVGQAIDGGISPHLRGYVPVDAALCITGLEASGKPHAECVHVFSQANASLIAAAPLMAQALRAHHAWAYAEHAGLGSFEARGVLCSHANYLTAKALAAADGRDFDAKYKGRPRLIVWPEVRLDRSDEAEAEALVAEVLEHEAAAKDNGG